MVSRYNRRRDRRARSTGRDILSAPGALLLSDQGGLTQHRRLSSVHLGSGSVEDGIVERFKEGGGLPYSASLRFHKVMAEDSRQTVVAALTDHILPLVSGLVERLEEGIDILDVGCGSGRAINLMARTFPNSRLTGYDFSKEAIARARDEAGEHGATNIRFEIKDVTALDEIAHYDLVTTFDAVHDQAKPAVVLEGIANALKEDGVYLMQDVVGSSHVHNNLDHAL